METSKKAGEPQPMQVINNYGTIIIQNGNPEVVDLKAKNKMDFAAPPDSYQDIPRISQTGDFYPQPFYSTCLLDSFSTS